MREESKILVADRNRHVREFLKRELMSEGYRVRLAKNGKEVMRWIDYHEPFDLLIIDPNLPDEAELKVLEKLMDYVPSIPVVIHSYCLDYSTRPAISGSTVFVEKSGSSVEVLKKVVIEVLRKSKTWI
ncbi:MAG: hypothetical protein B1H13_02235 [Desulfobacteraceae bacterium 4484_190.3]|nr:MAG: hypothetical protein B1H13_02235 [Desulfobacteraceae bacterium 4484_190.3]